MGGLFYVVRALANGYTACVTLARVRAHLVCSRACITCFQACVCVCRRRMAARGRLGGGCQGARVHASGPQHRGVGARNAGGLCGGNDPFVGGARLPGSGGAGGEVTSYWGRRWDWRHWNSDCSCRKWETRSHARRYGLHIYAACLPVQCLPTSLPSCLSICLSIFFCLPGCLPVSLMAQLSRHVC